MAAIRRSPVTVSQEAVDPRVAAGLPAQLTRRAELLAAGAEPVGWKVGFNLPAVQQAFGIAQPISGFLTTATLVSAGQAHSLAGAHQPMAEPEVAIQIGAELAPDCDRAAAEAAIIALGPAIEVADVDSSLTDLAEIVARNVFHRAVLFGRPIAGVRIEDVFARVAFNGEPFGEVDPLEATLDPVEVVRLIARTIGAGGERLRPGDAIIAGSLVNPPVVSPGDELALDLGPLGSLSLAFKL
jgi:2-keto-4-pentenoate hydratase